MPDKPNSGAGRQGQRLPPLPSSLDQAAASGDLKRFAPRLLRWFAQHQRDLPWRRDRDPYRIWVSEIMLQQTQVATVIPYFERFLTAFPTVAHLAAAEEQEVLRLWEGLGYYRRARDLHRTAKRLVAEHGGAFPEDLGSWLALPGIGRYTAGAILSQAFDQRLPIVEANSKRVLSRYFGQRDDLKKPAVERWLWQAAEEVLPRRNCGQFNQALMELGALVCTPRAPQCGQCPVADACVALRLGLQEQIPVTPPAPSTEEVREACLVIRRAGKVLLTQRPATGRWAGLWEFPHGPLHDGETYEAAASRLGSELTGLTTAAPEELRTLRHGVTRFRIVLVCFEAHWQAGTFRSSFYPRGLWLEPGQLAAYPVSAPQRLLARQLLAGTREKRLF